LRLSEVDAAAFPRIYTLLLDGHSFADIRQALATEHPQANADLLFRYTQNAFEQVCDRSFRTVAGFCLEATRDLYRKMLEIGDFEGALRAVKQLSTLADAVANAHETKADQIIDLFSEGKSTDVEANTRAQ
jgi:hypothetical protein